MATLYDYLAGLTVGGSPLVWSNQPLTESQLKAAAGKPYVRVEELDEVPTVSMYGNLEVLEMIVDVQIYQPKTSTGAVPTRADITKLYFDIWDAYQSVNSWTYSQPLIAISRELGLPPRFDEDSGGLVAMVRFRLLFPRG